MAESVWNWTCVPQYRHVAKVAGWKTLLDAVSHCPMRYEDATHSASGIPDDHCEKRQIIVTGRIEYLLETEYKLKFRLLPTAGDRIICRFDRFAKEKHAEFPNNEIVTLSMRPVRADTMPDDDPAWTCMYPARIYHLGGIKPIYKGLTGANGELVAEAVSAHIEQLKKHFGDKPNQLVADIIAIHEPASVQQANEARRRLARLEASKIRDKYLSHQKSVGIKLRTAAGDVDKVIAVLPFSPTSEQDSAIRGVISGMEKGLQKHGMSGDVSTGKTMASAAIAGVVVQSEIRAKRNNRPIVALLAPTSVLAAQLAEEYRKCLPPLKVGLVLPDRPKPDSYCHILIGTTALFSQFGPGRFPRLLIVDEEHRFGVEDRERLVGPETYCLTMTATPIPRTAGLLKSGGITVQRLTKTPKVRHVTTHLAATPEYRRLAFTRALETLKGGGKVIVIYPSIDSDKMSSIGKSEGMWRQVWPDLGIIHGDTTDAEDVLARFRNGDIRLLLASTRVECGIDVPDATLIVVSEAERFGLATLHQLRGRVGRGGLPGKCILISGNKKAQDRLRFFCRCNNGFDLAEYDMTRRGLGVIEGREQSGHRFRYLQVDVDTDLMQMLAA